MNTNITDFKGTNNPMYGKKHNEQTKRKISDTQKARWDNIRKMIADKETSELTELKKIVREEIAKLIAECKAEA